MGEDKTWVWIIRRQRAKKIVSEEKKGVDVGKDD